MSESRTQLPARRPVDGVEAGADQDFHAAGCASATASRCPCGARWAATSRVLGARCAARAPLWQPGSGLPVYFLALLRRGAALRCAAAAICTVASIRRHWLPLCGRARFPRGLSKKAQQLVCAHSIATSPRAESSESDYAAAAYDPWGAEKPAAAQPALIESERASPRSFVQPRRT